MDTGNRSRRGTLANGADNNSLITEPACQAESNVLLLTASESSARGSLAGRSSQYRVKSLPWVDRLLAWYRKTVSHRQAGDRIELAPDYLLFEVKSKDAL